MAAKTISLRTRRNSRLHGRSRAGNLLNFLFLALIGVFMALPMVYAVSSAFKPLDELFLFPPRFLVRRPTLDNFSDLFRLMSTSWVPFTRYMFNTVMLAVLATAGNVVICSMAAYMLEKRKFPGSGLMYQTVVLALMFSGAVTAIPNYLIMARLNWIDNYLSLIVPAFATPIGLFLMKQFMGIVHDSLIESAKLDGAGEWQIFWRICLPQCRAALYSIAILVFIDYWNMVEQPIVLLPDAEKQPLSVYLSTINTGEVGLAFAIATIYMVPTLLLFLHGEEYLVEGIATQGSVKG